MRTIGLLSSRSLDESAHLIAAFRDGLAEAGHVEGRNLSVEFRFADGVFDRLPRMAAELIERNVAVLVTVGAEPSALTAKAVTQRVPIVFVINADPVKLGLVTSLSRPGGNITGFTMLSSVLVPKRLELLHELVPQAATLAFLVNPRNPNAGTEVRDAEAAAGVLGVKIRVLSAGTEPDLDAAFADLVRRRVGAIAVAGDPFFAVRRQQIVALAARHRVPAIYNFREYVQAGGLMSYAPNLSIGYRGAGLYAGKILNGAKPADLPVEQPTKFELVINLKTAKALGLTIPPSLLQRADEIIQ
jgi:putative ABC transport system substrate-binding protein